MSYIVILKSLQTFSSINYGLIVWSLIMHIFRNYFNFIHAEAISR